MSVAASSPLATRRPRFRRAPNSTAFRVTSDDIAIIRHIARCRFLRSTHIAALVGRSLDRTNDRLCHLFHAGYIDRPRAQLDHYPSAGSAPMVYALADRGARLLRERSGFDLASIEWSRHNREATRPFIEHQLEIADFKIAMRLAAEQAGHRFLDAEDILIRNASTPFAMRVTIAHHGSRREIGLVPDLGFSIELASGAHRNFLVEIDRGTMPITRATLTQTSIERKLLGYVAARAARKCDRLFKWKAWRMLIVTTDRRRVDAMIAALRSIDSPGGVGPGLFLLASRDELAGLDLLSARWRDADGARRQLL